MSKEGLGIVSSRRYLCVLGDDFCSRTCQCKLETSKRGTRRDVSFPLSTTSGTQTRILGLILLDSLWFRLLMDKPSSRSPPRDCRMAISLSISLVLSFLLFVVKLLPKDSGVETNNLWCFCCWEARSPALGLYQDELWARGKFCSSWLLSIQITDCWTSWQLLFR